MKLNKAQTDWLEVLQHTEFDNVFNPYVDQCDRYDKENAPQTRFSSLTKIFKAAIERDVDAMWIGRDLGYNGGRRTGLAFTDDAHYLIHTTRWGVPPFKLPTRGKLVSERTGKVIWAQLNKIPDNVFLWNVFPFHPHEPRISFTNRAHNADERKAGLSILQKLIELIEPSRLVAVGNDAAKSATEVCQGLEVVHVRHPSYGGQNDFIRQIEDLYPSMKAPETGQNLGTASLFG